MTGESGWEVLRQALAETPPGARTHLWLRDDDAVTYTPALRRLTALCAAHRVPLVAAVIPAHADASLAAHLAATPGAKAAVHGWAHANHAPSGARAREVGGARPVLQVHRELAAGLQRLDTLLGSILMPVLVPPWNRIDTSVLPGLADLGFRALSTFGWPDPITQGDLVQVNTHVDLIDWKGGRVGRAHEVLAAELALAVRLARGRGGVPVGVLTHHLVMDEKAWRFLESLLVLTGAREDVLWVNPFCEK